MKHFETSFLENIKQISIINYLASKGIEPQLNKTREFLYLSPLRKENTASFRVNVDKNLWQDFGSSQGGSVIDLVMQLEHLDFVQAVKFLKNFSGTTQSNFFSFSRPTKEIAKNSLEVLKVKDLQNQALIDYLSARQIPYELARKYTSELYYRIKEKHYFAISFKNNSGGYAIRNKYFKGSTSPNDYSLMKGQNGKNLTVFEGFIDFLSACVLYQSSQPSNDVLILNSLSNLKKARKIIRTYKKVFLFLDNDKAGKEVKTDLMQAYKNVSDCSNLYKSYKDLNEYLLDHPPTRPPS